jgi:hypothetical protein
MSRGKGLDGAARNETVRGRVRGYSAENSRKNTALDFLQPRFGRFNQPDLTARLRQYAVTIMMQLLRLLPVPESFKICEPQ